MVYSIPERKFILEIYLKTKSYKKVCELFIKDKTRRDSRKRRIKKIKSRSFIHFD
jgi:hypothetical protein